LILKLTQLVTDLRKEKIPPQFVVGRAEKEGGG
jgi:hypothetical protein